MRPPSLGELAQRVDARQPVLAGQLGDALPLREQERVTRHQQGVDAIPDHRRERARRGRRGCVTSTNWIRSSRVRPAASYSRRPTVVAGLCSTATRASLGSVSLRSWSCLRADLRGELLG